MELRLYTLDRNPVLEVLVMPLDPVERAELEDRVQRQDGATGVRVWNTTLLVDYDYYDYCHRCNIPFGLIDVPVRSEAEAIIWVCKNQLERKNLPEERRKYLIGKLSLAERTHNQQCLHEVGYSAGQQGLSLVKLAHYNTLKTVVRGRIGKEYHFSYMTVRKYETYALALDTLRESYPDFVQEHLAGRLRLSIERVESLSLMPEDRRLRACQQWLHKPVVSQPRRKKKKEATPIKSWGHKPAALPAVSIKDMPVYDPDAEMISLVFTIPSWRRSIARVQEVADVDRASREARLRLIEALMLLEVTADKLIDVVKEEPDERL